MNWYFVQLPLLCAAVAIIDLDTLHFGQWMIARPIILGPFLGGILGQFGTGAWVGGTLELLTLDDLPVGHWIPLNGAVATASALLLCAGKQKVALSAAMPTGVLLGFIFRKVEAAIRTWRASLVRAAESYIHRGRGIPTRLFARAVGVHAAAVLGFLYIGVVAVGQILAESWPAVPQKIQSGLDLALQTAPWLGLATLIQVFRPR